MTAQIAVLYAASSVLLAVVVWRIWRSFFPSPSRLDSPFLFFVLVFGCMLAMRLAIIFWPHDVNMDESQMLAQAMRFLKHPVPWRDVDGTTSGPLNSQLLSVPIFFGAPADWRTSRAVLWGFHCLTLLMFYLVFRVFGSRADAQFALLPSILFYALVIDPDYIHYSSETLPVFLISFGIFLLAREWGEARISKMRLFLIGCSVGAVPFAKMQAAPLAMFSGFAAIALVAFKYKRQGLPKGILWAGFGVVALGSVLVPGAILGVVILKGAFGDFWKSYILASAAYATQESLTLKLKNIYVLLRHSREFRPYLVTCAVAVMTLFVVCRGKIWRIGTPLMIPLIFAALVMLDALFCIFTAGKGWIHYNLLLVPPLTLLFGFACLGFTKIRESQGQSAAPKEWISTPKLVCIFFMLFQLFKAGNFFRGMDWYAQMHGAFRLPLVMQSIREVTHPGESMSIWGWMPRYYLESGLYPGTRDAIGHYVISAGLYQDYFRSRYLRDLEQDRPVIFMDAVAGGIFTWQWTAEDRHESFPALAKFIKENYSLWKIFDIGKLGNVPAPIRVYVLKERMTERKLSLNPVPIADEGLVPTGVGDKNSAKTQ